MAWTLLVIAGLLEIVWASALAQSAGLSRLVPSVVGISVSLLSFALLALALTRLPLGTAYAVWVGIGVAGVAVVGILYFGDTVTAQRLLFIALILGGVIGLRIVEG